MRAALIFILVIFTIKASGQSETETQFATRVLKALKTKDFEKVKELFPTATQWDRFEKMTGKPFPDNFVEAYLVEIKQEFERLFRLGDKYNVNWTKFKVDKIEFESKRLQDTEAIGLTGRIYLKHRKRIVTLDEVVFMKLDSIYYLMRIRNLTNGKISNGKN